MRLRRRATVSCTPSGPDFQETTSGRGAPFGCLRFNLGHFSTFLENRRGRFVFLQRGLGGAESKCVGGKVPFTKTEKHHEYNSHWFKR